MDFRRRKIVQHALERLTKRAIVVPLSGFEMHYDAEKEPFRVLLFTPTDNVYIGECPLKSAMTTSEFSRASTEIRSALTPDADVNELAEVLTEFGYSVEFYDPPKRIPPAYTGPAGKSPAEQHEEVKVEIE